MAKIEESAEAFQRTLSVLIKKCREAAGLSLSKLEEKSGISRQTISNAEKGDHNTGITTIYRILGAIGVKMSLFFQQVEEGGNLSVIEKQPENNVIVSKETAEETVNAISSVILASDDLVSRNCGFMIKHLLQSLEITSIFPQEDELNEVVRVLSEAKDSKPLLDKSGEIRGALLKLSPEHRLGVLKNIVNDPTCLSAFEAPENQISKR